MPTVIRVENLSKYYRLGLIGGKTLHDDLNRWWARVRKRPDPLLKIGQEDRQNGNGEYLWALRDINFEVQQGEIVGIIGRNGAGKSTLLKILSRITAPTSGQVKVKGRIASLLEVGTGFHPELTGRENIYLNGAILGMKKAEIDRKFDEIVAFAEVEKFIDTPVKRYSSGMYVRLAFAVAAHLEPEILIVDEVLAVGDVAFQKKCIGKMRSVATHEGRTVLFVSHNLIAVQKLCTKGILLSTGCIISAGNISKCIDRYLTSPVTNSSSDGKMDLSQLPQDEMEGFRFLSISLMDLTGRMIQHIGVTQEFYVEIEFELQKFHNNLIVGFAVHTRDEFSLFATHNNDFGQTYSLEPGHYSVKMRFGPNYLQQGQYFLSLGAISAGVLVSHISTAISLTVEPVLTEHVTHIDNRIGALFIPMEWSELIKL